MGKETDGTGKSSVSFLGRDRILTAKDLGGHTPCAEKQPDDLEKWEVNL